MKIYELSKQLGITNKELIAFFKEQGFKVSSHMQSATDDMIDLATEYFKDLSEKASDENEADSDEDAEEDEDVSKSHGKSSEKIDEYVPKKFAPDDIIACRSVTPWKLVATGVDKSTLYNWSGYGDVDYVTYRDLQSMRRKSIIRKPKILIEDADLCYQWRNDLGDTYKLYLGVEYPEEFFDLSDEKFRRLLRKAPQALKDVIKYTAMNMIRNENYPSIQKLMIVDEILGTCIKDFL